MKLVLIILALLCFYLLFYLVPTYINKLLQVIKKHKHFEKTIYLTFDDGPSKYTDDFINLLKKENVKATFFCVASFMLKNSDVIKKMQKEGHLIGAHSYQHDNGLLTIFIKEKNNFQKMLNIFKKFNINLIYFRPPWGHINLGMLREMKKNSLKMVMWDVMAEDWKKNITSEEIYQRIIKRTHGGDIICLHDGRGVNDAPKRTLKALKKAILELKKKGFVFKTIDEYEKK